MPYDAFNALILAAGRGTRLRPHTHDVPKPLFAVAGQPILDIIICQLLRAGAGTIAVNVHHLHDQILSFIESRHYPVPVVCRYEPELLGTGGAIGNFADVLGSRPFLVINSDVLTDISIKQVLKYHTDNRPAATLVMQDQPEFNKVVVDAGENIVGFDPAPAPGCRLMAFTGLQVIDPVIYDYIPPGAGVSSIDVFSAMIADGRRVKAFKVCGHYWNDLGTPASFRRGVIDTMAPNLFERLTGSRPPWNAVECHPLDGDGSDRKWFRLRSGPDTMVVADHGIHTRDAMTEFDSFVAIGRHLFSKGVAVPEIYAHDRFSGLVFLADLGDTLLQAAVDPGADPETLFDYYKQIIDQLIFMHIQGAQGFDPAWAYQGPSYDRQMIVEKEGLYFADAFARDYLKMADIDRNALLSEFFAMAGAIEACGQNGFMHRDFQSRNIMVTKKGFFFIDFQAGRIGPVQYDLASLLTDPYVRLSGQLRDRLLQWAMERLKIGPGRQRRRFQKGYQYCAVSRNLQALGAFAFLSRVKQKTGFAGYMPAALDNLASLVQTAKDPALPVLAQTVNAARQRLCGQK